MQVGIFYFTDGPVPKRCEHGDIGSSIMLSYGRWVHVRVELVEAETLSDALDKAKPREGEHVMNTHEIKGESE